MVLPRCLDVVDVDLDFSSTRYFFKFEQVVYKDMGSYGGVCGLGLQIPIQITIVMRGIWGKHIRVIRL